MCLKEQFSHYWNNNRTINIIFIAYKNGYHGQNCSSSCPIPGYLCVTVTLHTVILLMAVNNLQGVLIFIKYTPKVFRWQNLCTRRFGEKTEEIVQNVVEKESRQTISGVSTIVGLSTGTIHSFLTDHINTSRVSAKQISRLLY